MIQQWFKERNPQFLVNLSALTNGRVAASGGRAGVVPGDAMVGGYGISGGTSDQDEVMARHARAKVGWRHAPGTDLASGAEGSRQRAI